MIVVVVVVVIVVVVIVVLVLVFVKRYMSEKMCVPLRKDKEVGRVLTLSDLHSHVVNKISLLVAKIR